MLNRTNRTLANRNRLNLGTRSLALVGSEFNGKATLRIRQAQGDSPRDAIADITHSMLSRHSASTGMSPISCSSPEGPWCALHRVSEPVVAVPVKTSGPATERRAYPNVKRGLDLRYSQVRAARPAAAPHAAAGG